MSTWPPARNRALGGVAQAADAQAEHAGEREQDAAGEQQREQARADQQQQRAIGQQRQRIAGLLEQQRAAHFAHRKIGSRRLPTIVPRPRSGRGGPSAEQTVG